MQTKKKIVIGIVALTAILLFVLFLQTMNSSIKMLPPEVEEETQEPSIPNSVDQLLEEMEFGNIVFNAPKSINIVELFRLVFTYRQC